VLVPDPEVAAGPGLSDFVDQGRRPEHEEIDRTQAPGVGQERGGELRSSLLAGEIHERPNPGAGIARRFGRCPGPGKQRLELRLGQRHDLTGPVAAGERLGDATEPSNVGPRKKAVSGGLSPRDREPVPFLPDAKRVGRKARRPGDGTDRPERLRKPCPLAHDPSPGAPAGAASPHRVEVYN
jgi:hypothetical protein